mgnify:CR=1 FL=1
MIFCTFTGQMFSGFFQNQSFSHSCSGSLRIHLFQERIRSLFIRHKRIDEASPQGRGASRAGGANAPSNSARKYSLPAHSTSACANSGRCASISWYEHSSRSVTWITPSSSVGLLQGKTGAPAAVARLKASARAACSSNASSECALARRERESHFVNGDRLRL